MKKIMTRRDILKTAALVSAYPVLGFASTAQANSVQINPEDAQPRALEYVHQSTVANQFCSNCTLYTGDASADWGPCAIFPGKNVASAGWCKAWAVKG